MPSRLFICIANKKQNEFFSAQLHDPAGQMPNKMLCITPDLITVIDSHSGTALATHELRYGLRVAVLGIPAHHLWLTEAGLTAGGPSAFGYVLPIDQTGCSQLTILLQA
jgi:DUF917 family protein